MLAATVVFSLLLGAPAAADADSPAPQAAAKEGAVVQTQEKVGADTQGIFDDLMGRRYAFSMNDNLHPSVADSLIGFFLGGLLCTVAGPVWLGGLIAGDPPEGYWEEALVTWLFYAVPVGAAYVLCGWIPYIGWAFSVLMCPVSLALAFYLVPVNVINAWDRKAKQNGVPAAKKKKKKSSALAVPKDDALAFAEPQMAY